LDLLRKHLEKLILGLALIALLASIALLLHSLTKTRTDVAEMTKEVQAAANGGSDIKILGDSDFEDVPGELTNPKVKFDTTPTEGTPALRGNLYEPVDYIYCYNEACNKVIPYAADKCPFCGKDQPPKPDGGPKSNDRDNDGIPNHVEQKYPFLNPDNPYDALQDQDQDGFLNVEEFKANTDLENATSIPPLGALLRIARLVGKPLPIMLRRINRNNSDDPAVWTITLQTYDTAKKTWRSRLTAVGKTVDGFTIRSAAFEQSSAPPAKPSAKPSAKPTASQTGVVVVAPETGGEPYTLREGKNLNEHDQFVSLGYFLSRNAQYASRGGVRFYTNKVGDTLALTRGRDSTQITEKYLIESIAADAVQVLRTDPPAAQGTEPLRIKVPPFNQRTDFTPQMTTGGVGGDPMGGPRVPGGGGPGVPGVPGDLPGGRAP
jgi:hypothetical protein